MIVGIGLDRKNPEYTSDDFVFWMPQFTNYVATPTGQNAFDKVYKLVNNKIFNSIFGTDWELAMSYGIAHYLTLIGQQMQAPSGSSLAEIAGGGATRGVLASAGIGEFSKSYDLTKTMLDTPDAMFWNQTSYGSSLMALLKTKSVPSIFVVTNNNVDEGWDARVRQAYDSRTRLKNPAMEDDIRLGKEAISGAGLRLVGNIEDYDGSNSTNAPVLKIDNPATPEDVREGKQYIVPSGELFTGVVEDYDGKNSENNPLVVLTNPASAEDVRKGKEMMTDNLDVIVGNIEDYDGDKES